MTWEQFVRAVENDKSRKRPSHEEDALQEACIKWFDYSYPEYSLLLFHSANEGKVTRPQAVRRKKMGVRAGVADLLLLLSNKSYSYLAMELKTPEGRQSQSQKKWQEVCEKNGGRYAIVRSVDEFIDIIKRYLNNKA